MVRSILGRACVPAVCFLALFMFSACSVQKSGTKLDSAQTDAKKPAMMNPAAQASFQDRTPVRVDYLTPLSEVVTPEVFVYKEKRRLYLIQSNVLVRDYPVGLGFHPVGDKEKEGDGRTPEGDFIICQKNPAGRFNKSLGLNYPEKKHAERAFFAGVINPLQFKDILLANERKTTPPWTTTLGGAIFIHAGGAHKDWTDGCVALYNSDMEELFRVTDNGTPVHIRP